VDYTKEKNFVAGGQTMWEELQRYRRMITLENGERVLLRPLNKDDGSALVKLFRKADDDDLAYFRNDVRDEALVVSWAENLDLSRVFPVVAVVQERIVGDATLHIGRRFNRHIGWVRIYLDHECRRKGIGTELIKTLIEIARRVGLQQIVAEIVSNQVQAIKAFEALGFKQEYRHADYYLFRDDETLDLVAYVLRLSPPPGKF
jgi:RimJ/RimL family protein N-acetyltransferase